jgi:hypothetical protein
MEDGGVMRQNYNSFKYWENRINQNKTIRGHMFMEIPPKEKTLFIHTLIFSKKNGINNIYSYFPEPKVLLGYIQYSFLQEAFYKWIYGKDKVITTIPSLTVDKIIKNALKTEKIKREEAELMLGHYHMVANMWDLPREELVDELIKFAKLFNKAWHGSNREFLYLKIFKNIEEVCEFVITSTLITGDADGFKQKIGVTIDTWREICREAIVSIELGEQFRDILLRNLSEVF